MTTASPGLPATGLDRLRWAVADAWAVTGRDLLHWARQPAPVVVNLLFPVLMVVMFGYLFGGAIVVPGGGSYRSSSCPACSP
jgi:ABC-2 type transport system permease protein